VSEEIKEIIEEIKDSYYETQPTTKFYKNISLIEEEIERLNKERETDIKYNKYLQKELAEAHSIIKEAREYIVENYPTSTINYQDDKYNLLEILDKKEE
jgi:hypothetical protein